MMIFFCAIFATLIALFITPFHADMPRADAERY
jgi:hypothetical protein